MMTLTLHETWIVFIALTFGLSLIGTKLLIPTLHSLKLFDVPNARSNHTTPVVRGGGIAVFGSLLVGLWLASELHLFANAFTLPIHFIMALSAVFLISLLDDIRHIPAPLRLAVHTAAVCFMLWQQPFAAPLFHGIPVWADQLVCIVLWVWFMNAFNFMDGIDGISGVESLSICLGVGVLAYVTTIPSPLTYYALITGLATLGFLVWNWSPAKIFLGDCGSLVLGFVLGYMLLLLASNGHVIPALILPLYYVMDSGVTLLKRLSKRETLWQAHSDHFYQQAVRLGKTHKQTASLVALVNSWLIVFAYISLNHPNIGLGLAAWVTLGLLAAMVNKVPAPLKDLSKMG